MASENSEHVARTRELIERTRRELVQMHDEIQAARVVIDQSRKLLVAAEPAAERD
jgi:hypothetical protein